MSASSAAKERVKTFDLAKGIGMLAIIATHMNSPLLLAMTSPFNVAIFYFCSGCFLSSKRSLSQTASSRFRSLIIPYCWISLLYLILFALRAWLNQDPDLWNNLSGQLLAAVYGAGNDVTSPVSVLKIGAIWFLPASFWGLLIARWTIEEPNPRLLIALALAWLSIWSIERCWLPFSLQPGCTAALYILAGYGCYHSRRLEIDLNKSSVWLAFAACLCIWILSITEFKGFYLVRNQFSGGVLDFLGSFCIIYMVFVISRMLERWNIFRIGSLMQWIGVHSLTVLGIHFLELRLVPWFEYFKHIPLLASSHALLIASVYVTRVVFVLISTYIFSKVKDRIKTGRKTSL